MRALNVLILLLAVFNPAFAQQSGQKLESYLSDIKKQEFSYDYKKVEADSSKLRDSWIQPLIISYAYSKSDPYKNSQESQKAAIVMDQPIFQSGGIYYGIKFAQASRKYSDYTIDVAKRKLIKDTVALLMQIKQTEFKKQKQKLQIKNAEINLEQKKEEYLNGQLDSGFLDSAIIQTNEANQALFDIEANEQKLISQFKSISDMNYETAEIPKLRILNESEFLKNNIDIYQIRSQEERDRYNKNVTVSKYLPKISITAGYNWDKTKNQQYGGSGITSSGETDYYNYGIKASIPLDINTFRDVESAKVEYLKSQVVVIDKKRELKALFEQVMQNIKNFENKIQLSKKNKELYEKLLEDTAQLFQAGYKTQYDVDTLKNSVEIQKLDTKIYEMDKQLELLSLYEKFKDEI
ncbi:TolC family protein [Sulfurimonas sp. HSL-1716]|uniref:TolC family protein n=1 Tax=Hydrocurvibacter sulfurireducens TaxID=3131937 RepID=UPI0031F8169F